MNRFTKDIDTLDNLIADAFRMLAGTLGQVVELNMQTPALVSDRHFLFPFRSSQLLFWCPLSSLGSFCLWRLSWCSTIGAQCSTERVPASLNV